MQMTGKIYGILAGVLATLLIILSVVFHINNLNSEIKDQKNTIESINKDLSMKELSLGECNSTVDEQNYAITKLQIDKNASEEAFNNWKNQPEKIKYIHITKYLDNNISVDSNSCEDIKKTLNQLSKIKYEDL